MPAEPPVRITLRPPPHRDYLQGYQGIPPSSPSPEDTADDPLLPLPKIERSLAHLTGTVEVRSTTAHGSALPVKAKWLSVELEKIEVVPPLNPTESDPTGNRKKKGGRRHGASSGPDPTDAKFVELIGTGPSKLWDAVGAATAAVHTSTDVATTSSALRPVLSISTTARGYTRSSHGNNHNLKAKLAESLRLRKVFRVGSSSRPYEEDSEDDEGDGFADGEGYANIPDGSYPFSIPLPEGLPPTVELLAAGRDRGGSGGERGIAYQIVASLAVKPKKSMRGSATKPTLVVASAPIYLDKADILPAWPAYSPLLPSPLPPLLPWTSTNPALPTPGETREATVVLDRASGGETGSGAGEVWMKATRATAAFGPGDPVRLWVQVGSGAVQPVKLTRLDFVLCESLTYRYPSPANPAYLIRAAPEVTAVLSADVDVSSGVLYQHEPLAFEMGGSVPLDWKRMTVRTAKHIDVSYHLKIRALLESGDELVIDHWPVIVANIATRTANGIVREIGWVRGLCERPGLNKSAPHSSSSGFGLPQSSSRTEEAGTPVPDSASSPARFRIANPSASTPPPPPLPQAVQEPSPIAGFVPSTRAEEEKLRYYEQATRTRDVLQSSLRGVSMVSSEQPPRSSHSLQNTSSPISPSSMCTYATDRHTDAQVHTATLVMQHMGAPPPAQVHPALEPSMTTVAWSGSEVGRSAPVPKASAVSSNSSSSSPVLAALGRSLSRAEQEKARLYNDAKETARQRQEEARLLEEQEEERQGHPALAAEDAFEQAQDAFERRLILEAEEERRQEEERLKAEFEASERARIRAEEERWRIEEEERHARALAEREEKKRRAEKALADELRRFEEQRRAQAAERSAEIERQADERRREDDMKRQRADEIRRLDEERERKLELERRHRAAARAVEEEEQQRRHQHQLAQAAEEARRREQAEEDARRQEEQRRRDREFEMSELAQLRAEQQRLREEAEALRRELAERSQSHGHVTTSPAPNHPASGEPGLRQNGASLLQHGALPLERAPSVVSFAPSMSAANATAEAYAQAIRQQSLNLSDDNAAAYLRQLRQRAQTSSSSGPAYPGLVTSKPSSASVVSTLPPTSLVSTIRAPSAPPVPPLLAQTSSYKTAAEEKEEEAARQRRRAAADTAAAASPVVEAPPSYPTGPAPSSTAPTPRGAAEEKAELERYYAAKAAVDVAQQSQSLSSEEQHHHHQSSTSAPAYPAFARSGTAPPLGSTDGATIAPGAPSLRYNDEDDQRDPSIAAGKRTAPPPSAHERATSAASSASAPLVAQSLYSNAHRTDFPRSVAQDQNVYFGRGGGGVNGSAYESVTQQIYDYHQQPGV